MAISKAWVGSGILIMLIISGLTIDWFIDEESSVLKRNGVVIAEHRWHVESERTYINKNSHYRRNVICPRLIAAGGYETATRCYYPPNTYELLSRSLINTKLTEDNWTVHRTTPYYAYGTRGSYAGFLYESFMFTDTVSEEQFPDDYNIIWTPKDTRNYKLIWRVWRLKDLKLTPGNYSDCVYRSGYVKIDLKESCSDLERAEVKDDSTIWFYFKPERDIQEMSVDLVDPSYYLYLDGVDANRTYEYETTVNITTNLTYIDILDDTDRYLNQSSPFNYTIDLLRNDEFSDGNEEYNVSITSNSTYICCTDSQNQTPPGSQPVNQLVGTVGTAEQRRIMAYLWDVKTSWFGNISFYVDSATTMMVNSTSVTCDNASGKGNSTFAFQLLENDAQNQTSGTIVKTVYSKDFPICKGQWNDIPFNIDTNQDKYLSIYFFVDHNYNGTPSASGVGDYYFTPNMNTTRGADEEYPWRYYDAIWKSGPGPTGSWSDLFLVLNYGGIVDYSNAVQPGEIQFDNRDIIDGLTYDIIGYQNGTYPKDIQIDIGSDGTYDISFLGILEGSNLRLDHFDGYDNEYILSVPNPSSVSRNIVVPVGSNITKAEFQMNGVSYGAVTASQTGEFSAFREQIGLQSFNYSENKVVDKFQFKFRTTAATGNCGIINGTDNTTLTSTTFTTTEDSNSDYPWIDCDITDYNVTAGEDYLIFFNSSDRPYWYFGPDDYSDGVMYYCSSGTCSPSDWVEYSYYDQMFKIYTLDFPGNLSVDTGYDRTVDYTYDSEINGTKITIDMNATVVQQYANYSAFCNNMTCTIPILMAFKDGGKVNITNMNVTSTGFNPLNFTSYISTLNDQLNMSLSTKRKLNITYAAKEMGIIGLSNLKADYRGEKNITVYAHNATYGDSVNRTIIVRYSQFNVSIIPQGIDAWDIGPNIISWTQNYIPPYGNEDGDGNPFFQVSRDRWNHSMEVYVKYNESIDSCATTWFEGMNETSNSTFNVTLSTSSQILVDNLTDANINISSWTNISCSSSNGTLIMPYFCFFSICSDCVLTSDWESNCEWIE